MGPLRLKAAATAMTLGAAALSALYVTAHVKTAAAPLHPAVAAESAAGGPRMTLTPSVRAANVAPVTSTYAS